MKATIDDAANRMLYAMTTMMFVGGVLLLLLVVAVMIPIIVMGVVETTNAGISANDGVKRGFEMIVENSTNGNISLFPYG